MAPEQARGEAVDHRADIWSFGLVLYEMAKGTRPAPAVRLRVEESSELERIVSKCLETDRDLRYQHAADLRTDLERLKRGFDLADDRRPLFGQARTRWTLVSAVAAAIVPCRRLCVLQPHRRSSPTRTRSCSAISPIRPAIPCSTRRCDRDSRSSSSNRRSSA